MRLTELEPHSGRIRRIEHRAQSRLLLIFPGPAANRVGAVWLNCRR